MRKCIRMAALLLCALMLALVPIQTAHAANTSLPQFDYDTISAQYAILYDLDTGLVLAEKNADQKLYPASTTKTMTCIVALENAADRLDEVITVGEEVKQISSDSSTIKLQVGEQMKLRDLLYGLMLSSGNDAANAIAVAVAGSLDGFVGMMNAKAEELGMTGTHYMNAHGLSDENHYTTAADMMKLVMYAEQNETFREITSTLTYSVDPTVLMPEGYTFINSNMLLHSERADTYDPEVYGVKTGFTSAAGHCLLAVAARQNVHLGLCIFMCEETERYNDAKKLLEFGFSCFEEVNLKSLISDRLPVNVRITNADASDLMRGNLLLTQVPDSDTETVLLLAGDAEELRSRAAEIRLVTNPVLLSVFAPVAEGQQVGTYRYVLDGETLLSGTLVSSRPVAEAQEVEDWRESRDGTVVGAWRFVLVPLVMTLAIVGIMIWVQGAFLRQYRRNRSRRMQHEAS